MGAFKSLVGKTFGRLTVIDIDYEKTKYGRYYYKCLCSCGNYTSVSSSHLITGHTQSCGCLNKEIVSEMVSGRTRKQNEIMLYEDAGFGIGFFNNSDNFFLFDIEDVDVVKSRCWYDGGGYARSRIRKDDENDEAFLHRSIISKYSGKINEEVDHINNFTYDNRKVNLRECDRSQNIKNTNRTTNTGIRYISFDKSSNKYVFQIDNERKKFNNLEECVEYSEEYLSNHPDPFRYDHKRDIRNKECNIPTIKNEIIVPFRNIE